MTFIIGELQNSNDPLQNNLVKENIRYGDILQEPFIDSYNNLTLKTLYILKYFNHALDKDPENKFLLKCDDDSYVHLESLWVGIGQIQNVKKFHGFDRIFGTWFL